MSSTISVNEIYTKYLEVYKSKIKLFNEELYNDLKQAIMNALEESLSGTSISTTVVTVTNKDKETNTFKYLVQELKSVGIQVSVIRSLYDSNEYQLTFEYDVNKY